MSAVPRKPPSGLSKDETALRIAAAHKATDPDIVAIYRIEASGGLEASPTEPIKLLEVTPNTSASGIMPVYLSPDAGAGILFPSTIIDITPQEWEDVKAGRLALPKGWTFNASKRLA